MAKGFNGFLSRFAPSIALGREVAQVKLDLLQNRRSVQMNGTYAPVGGGRRTSDFRRNSQDAHAAAVGARAPLAYIARDMLRNNPRVARANNLFAGHTVSNGIRPVVEMRSAEDKRSKDIIEGLIEDHLMTTAIDADGNSTLRGLQALSMKTIPISGEIMMRRRFRRASDGLPLPFQVQLLETDYLVATKNTVGRAGGRRIEEGIEYGPTGKAEAYHLYSDHPGSVYGGGSERRVTADNISHVFMVDRPGQRRGVSWYTPVMAELMDLHKFMQFTLKRQEMSAIFSGIFTNPKGDDDPNGDPALPPEMEAGGILELAQDEELTFNQPPAPVDFDPVTRVIDRVISTGLMLTYESFTGDYSQVNYTSGRMGRMDQDPMIRFWQDELLIARMMMPLTGWFKEAVALQTFIDPSEYRLNWTAPRRPVVDPTKDYPAMTRKVRAGLASRHSIIREAGEDPSRVDREILSEAEWADMHEMIFDSDPRRVSLAGVTQARAPGTDYADEEFADDDDDQDDNN